MADNRGKVESPLKMFPTSLRNKRGAECLKEGKQVNNCKIMGESRDIFVSEDELLSSPIIPTR